MGIHGKKRMNLSMDVILSKVSEYDIYRHYMPTKDWKLNDVTNSPFGPDENPSFLIGNKFGSLTHIAFNDTSKRGDCFSFVKQLYNLASLNDVLEKIDSDLGLGIRGVKKDYQTVIGTYKQPEITKRNSFIQVVTRKFTNEELAYWAQYYQTIDDLRANNIYSIKELFFNRQKFPLKDTELRFGYFYPNGGFWKIYRPTANKKSKWMGNVPLQTPWGIENLRKGENSLICKSLKDYMVCKKVFPYVCGIQNESLEAFSEDFIEKVKESSDTVFYGGDSDNPGKKASYAITGTFGFKHINPPDNLLESCCKDFADMGKIRGLEEVKKHFLIKNLIKSL